MEDQELRKRFDDVQDDVKELRLMLSAMQLGDEAARADMKVIAGNLNNAAGALATAALAIQKGDLKPEASHEKWLERVILILLGVVCALVGVKELLPALPKLLGG